MTTFLQIRGDMVGRRTCVFGGLGESNCALGRTTFGGLEAPEKKGRRGGRVEQGGGCGKVVECAPLQSRCLLESSPFSISPLALAHVLPCLPGLRMGGVRQ